MTNFIAGPHRRCDGVTVNAIAPALIEEAGMLAGDPGDPGELAERIPVGRLGKPAEVADLTLTILRNGYMRSSASTATSTQVGERPGPPSLRA